MANAASTIEIELEIRDAINRLGKLEGELKKSSSAMDRVANSTNKMESAFKSAKNAASALFAAISIQQIAQAADTFTRFANQIRIATNSAAEAAAVQKELYRVSQTTGTAIEDTTKLYSRLRIAADQLGSSQAETIRLTDIVAKSLAAAGTSSSEASGALLQLAQALNSPKVQAEEFNSLIDGMPNLLKEVEKQLGLTAGSLKKFVTDGNLTNQLFKDAILGSADAINEQFGEAQDTISTSFTRLNNAFILLVGNFEKSTGFFNTIASVISTLAENIDELARVLKAAAVGFAVAFAPKVIRAIYDTATAMKVLGAASKTNVIGALAALGFYIADITGGLDLLIEKLGLTKDQADQTSGAIVDLTKGGGGKGAGGAAPSGSQYAFPTIGPERVTAAIGGFPDYIQEIKSLEEIQELEDGLLEIRNEQAKAIAQAVNSNTKTVDIIGAQNVPLEEAVGFLNLENKLIESNIQKRKIELQQNKENLTYLEQATNYLKEQFGLTDRTAGAIISGVSGAGPNASRATNIAQSKSFEEAAAKLILSNEKVAAAIDKSFEILFDTIDPLIDILGDLLSAINRLIGALLEGAGNAIENFADSIGLGPDSYYGGGGFTRDIEALGGAAGGGSRPTNAEQAVLAAISSLDSLTSERSAVVQNLIETAEASGDIQATIIAFRDSVDALINQIGVNYAATYGDSPDFMKSFANAAQMLENMMQRGTYSSYQDFVENYNPIMTGPEGSETLREDSAILLAVANAEIAIEELVGGIAGSSTDISEGFEAVSDKIFETAEEQIRSIRFQQLSAEEQIETLHEQAMAALESQKALLSLIESEERRAELLGQIEAAEEKQLELYNLQISELQKLNEEREREANLLALQNIESGLQALLRDFERTIENIADLVQGLFDQVNELLFSDFNLASPQETFSLAQDTYESLLENAFDQDATEDDIKALQAFVNEYLTAARNVFKSSTTYAEIFESVLGDLTALGLQTGFNAPIQASSNLSNDLEEMLSVLDDDFAEVVNELIVNIKAASLAFAQQQIEFITEVTEIPLTLTGDDISISTSGLGGTIELTSANFSLDSTKLDLRLLMSTSMFTVDTSRLNFGTITPTATAGTPYLGVVTPTVSLNTSSVTDSFNSLSSAINLAISGLIQSINASTEFLNSSTGGSSGGGGSSVSYPPLNLSFTNTLGTGSFYGSYPRLDDYSLNSLLGELQRQFQTGTHGLGQNIASRTDLTNFFIAKPTDSRQTGFFIVSNQADLSTAQTYARLFGARYPYQNSGYQFDEIANFSFRKGGLVPDPMDTIPAMLSPGEYILSPETVRRYGVSNLNRLNSGDSAAINATSDPEVKRLLAELIVAVRENDTEVNVYADMAGQTKAGIEEFRSELRERTRRQGDQYVPARYI